MSFMVKQPSLAQAGNGADPKYDGGVKAAKVVPMGWGRAVFSPQWISKQYDVHSQSAGTSKPEWQYCSIAGKYRDGPIDFVGKVFQDGKEVANFDYTFAPGEESHTFTVNPSLASGRAWQAIVHRGTEDAPESIVANLRAKTGQHHPPYRGYAWIEWLNIDQGAGNTSVPTLAVEMGRHAPAVGAFGGGDSHPYGVNLPAAMYAFALAPNGGAMDPALLDPVHWGDQAVAFETTGVAGRTGNLTYLHPNFTEAAGLGDALSQMLAYADAFIYFDNGKMKFGWFPNAPVDGSTLPQITEGDLTDKPSGNGFPDWNAGPTSVTVVFKSFDKNYEDDAARYNAPTNQENTWIAAAVRKDRPFIHANDQAALMAAEIAAGGDDEKTTDLPTFKSRAVDLGGNPLMPGSQFNWSYGPLELNLVCRVVSRRIRTGNASDVLTICRERGAFPRPYVATVDDRVLPTDDLPGVINVADVRLWFLPTELGVRRVALLINRAKRSIFRALLYLSTNGSAPWENILDSRFFAAKGAVVTTINATATTVRVTSTSVDFERMREQSTIGQTDDSLLLLIDDELASVSAITVVSTNVCDYTVLRGRKGTAAAGHLNAAVAWLFYRSELQSADHLEFWRVRDGSNAYDATIATKHFKIALSTITADGDPKPDDPGLSLVLPDLSADLSLGFTIMLTNEAHTVACDASGAPLLGELGASSLAKSTVIVTHGGNALTPVAAGPNSDQFSIALGTVSNATATKESNTTVRADTMSADTATIEVVVNVAGLFSVSKIFTLSKATKGATGATGAPGAPGSTGATGNTVERRYIRSTIVPGTPTGDNPIGWTVAIPSGSDALWASEGVKDPSLHLVGSWTTPQRVSGNIVLYQTRASTSGFALIDGDLLFDPTDGFHPYRWENPGSGYTWVSKPFGDAAIANLSVGKLTAGTVQAAISIGTLGSITAGTGYGQFFVDSTQLKHGAMTIAQSPGLSGTEMDIISGNHQATAYAHNTGAAFLVQNNGTGKQAVMFDTGLIRGNSLECGSDGFDCNGASDFSQPANFSAGATVNEMTVMGTNGIGFGNFSNRIYQNYGIELVSQGTTWPVRINNGALLMGAFGYGSTWDAGKIYWSSSVYLYESGGHLYAHTSAGDIMLA